MKKGSNMTKNEERILQPLVKTGTAFYIFVGVLLVLTGWFLYCWYTQVSEGLVVTGMRSVYNAPNYMGYNISGGSPW